MAARKKTSKKKNTGRQKKTSAKKNVRKSAAKKTAGRRKSTTRKTAKKAAGAEIPETVLKKAYRMRKKGHEWPEIREATGYRATVLRPALREAGMDDILGPGAAGGTKTTKKKATNKKTTKKKTAKKSTRKASKKTTKKRGRAKKSDKEGVQKRSPKKTKKLKKVGDNVDLSGHSDAEVVDAVVGKKVTFKRNLDDKKPRTFKIKTAKMVKKSKKFGRVISLRAGSEGAYSIPVDWIIRIG